MRAEGLPQAIVFLIDNCSTSLNGDFYPSRLEAQKTAVERLASYFSKQNSKSQFAIGSLASAQFGVFASLTNITATLFHRLPTLQRGGNSDLCRGIRCAFLALHLRDSTIKHKRVIAMIGSAPEPAVSPQLADSIALAASLEGVCLDIVAFGKDVEVEPLQYLIRKIANSGSHFVFCPPRGIILSDAILSSDIGPGMTESRRLNMAIEEDPDLALTIQLSMQDQPDDPELAEAIRMSMEAEGFCNDPDVLEALQASLADQQPDMTPAEPVRKDSPEGQK
jgi:26S proteasome regulatory subunit N10